ncbi:hypothetical protein WJX81_004852 [Elliptochloris bilobata]|uniref:Uncharacterized protein n=1 Tax=Elliptochloris bilobata TaxID=381761 RepID=A0AAW1QTL1_9CHLO
MFLLMAGSHLVSPGGRGRPRVRVSLRHAGGGGSDGVRGGGAADDFFSRVHVDNQPHLQADADAGAAESITGGARPHDVMGGGRADGALGAGGGARPHVRGINEGEVFETFPEPADDPEAFLKRARAALAAGRSGTAEEPLDYNAGGGSFRLWQGQRNGVGPSREFASAASSLLDEDLGDEGSDADANGRDLRAGVARDERRAESRDEDDEDFSGESQEYDYEHFWDLAASEDAPPEEELEAALEVARQEHAAEDAAGNIAISDHSYGQADNTADELAVLLSEMLPSEASAASATAKGAAAAVINAAYARSSGAEPDSEARISRAASNQQDLLSQMSQPERESAMADAEAAAGAVIRAASAHAKELKQRTARAWRQLPDGGWQRIEDRGDYADPLRNWRVDMQRLKDHRRGDGEVRPASGAAEGARAGLSFGDMRMQERFDEQQAREVGQAEAERAPENMFEVVGNGQGQESATEEDAALEGVHSERALPERMGPKTRDDGASRASSEGLVSASLAKLGGLGGGGTGGALSEARASGLGAKVAFRDADEPGGEEEEPEINPEVHPEANPQRGASGGLLL